MLPQSCGGNMPPPNLFTEIYCHQYDDRYESELVI